MNMGNAKLLALGMAAVLTAAPSLSVFAAAPTASGSGIDTADLQEYNTAKEGGAGWQDSQTESATSDDANNYKQNTYDGKIHLFYDTTGGTWQDPGADPTKADDNHTYANGTYVVTIPTSIAYVNMPIGNVSTSDNYTVNVRGVIGDDQTITVSAESGNYLVNGSKKQEIQETTTQGKTSWSAAEVYGHLNTDGSLSGTDCTDNIKMTGTVTTSGLYEGAVQYTATLSNNTSSAGSGN